MSRRNLVPIALWCVCLSVSARIFASAICWGSDMHGAKLSPSKSYYNLGEKVTVACNSFGITKRRKTTCSSVDGWDEWVPNLDNYCGKEVMCEMEATIVHPMVSHTPGYITWYKDGDKVKFHCPEGYDLKGSKNAVCRVGKRGWGDGFFTGHVDKIRCEAQPEICKIPSSVPNGAFSPARTTFNVGETVTLNCNAKYVPDGSGKSTCNRRTPPTPGAKWNAEIKGCKRDPKTLCKLGNLRFRTIDKKKDMYEVGETISLSCHDLYKSDDAQESTCMSDTATHSSGYWEPKFSDCKPDPKVSCKLESFPDTIIEPKKNLYKVGDVITIQCSTGYGTSGPPKATCTAGDNGDDASWEPNVLGCERVGCERHDWISNGDFEPFKWFYKIGDKIALTCEVDTDLDGSSHSTCEMDGHTGAWKPPLGDCVKSKCKRPIVRGADISPSLDGYRVGNTIEVFCLTQRSGSPPVEPSASSECSKVGNDFYAEFVWEPSLHDTCDNQICLYRENFNDIINPKYDFYLPGESISLTCRRGFTAQGQRTSVCKMKDGKAQWEPVLGECIKDNCGRPRVNGASLTPAKNQYLPGEKVMVTCTIHTDIQPKETKCRTSTRSWGHWEPDLENYCGKELGCDMQQMIIHPKIYAVPRIVTWLSPGAQVTLHCIDGYELIGEKTSTCMAGARWGQGYYEPDVSKASCKEIPPSCDTPTAPQNGQLTPVKETYIVGDKIFLSCDAKYIFDGVAKASGCVRTNPTSKDTHWEPPIGTCRRDPQHVCNLPASVKPMVVAPGDLLKEFYEVGETITVSCLKGYKPESKKFTCEYDRAGKAAWDHVGLPISCVEIGCHPPSPLVRVSQPRNAYPVGVQISMSCADGMTLRGPEMSTCFETEDVAFWIPPLGTCVPIGLPGPPGDGNTDIILDWGEPGSGEPVNEPGRS